MEKYRCTEILICLSPDRMGEAQQILQCVQHLCIPARMVLDLGEGIFVPERVFDYYGVPLLDVQPYPVDTVGYCIGKRIFDIAFSIFAILFFLPTMMTLIASGHQAHLPRAGLLLAGKSQPERADVPNDQIPNHARSGFAGFERASYVSL